MSFIHISRNFRQISFIRHISNQFNRKNSSFNHENVFNEYNIKKAIAKFASMTPFRFQTRQPVKKAAFLIPLCQVGDKVGILYTIRANQIKKFGGQVGFPGGIQEIKDRCLEDTVLRETKRQLGISPANIDIWTPGSLIVTKGDIAVMPILGRIVPYLKSNLFNIDSKEIQDVFTVPLDVLCDPALIGYTQFRNTYSVPVFLGSKKRIWGITAVMTNMCLSSILPFKEYAHRIKYIAPIRSSNSLRR